MKSFDTNAKANQVNIRLRNALLGFLAVLFAVSAWLSLSDGRFPLAAAGIVVSENTPVPTDSVEMEASRVDSSLTVDDGTVGSEPARLHDETMSTDRYIGEGEASFYGHKFAGRPTASGEVFDPTDLTAAHRTLPFGTQVRVTNMANGRSVVVRVNDRGPYAADRLIDLSRAAAMQIGMVQAGTANVRLELISES